jgi:hypothetical protein
VYYGGNYSISLAIVAGAAAIGIVILTASGVEKKGVVFGTAD